MQNKPEITNNNDRQWKDIIGELNALKDSLSYSLHDEAKSIDTIELWNSDKKTNIFKNSADELNTLANNIISKTHNNPENIHISNTPENQKNNEKFFLTLDIWEHASTFKTHFPVSYATFEKLLIGKNVTQDIQAFAMGTLESVETIVIFVKDILLDIARLLLNPREEMLNSK